MKKAIFILSLLLILSTGSLVFADEYPEISNEDLSLLSSRAEEIGVEIVHISDSAYVALRELAGKTGADIQWIEETKGILMEYGESSLLLHVQSGIVAIDGVEKDLGGEVVIREGSSYAPIGLLAVIEQNNVENVEEGAIEIQSGNKADLVTIRTDSGDIKRHFKLENPYRLVIDINGFEPPVSFPTGATFERIRHSVDNNGLTRLVFDLKDDYAYSINENGVGIEIAISDDGTFEKAQENIQYRDGAVVLKTSDYEGYEISRSSNPFSVNAKVPAKLVESEIRFDVDGEFIKGVKPAPDDGGTLVIVETDRQCAFGLVKNKDEFIITISEPVVENADYSNHDGNRITTIPNAGGTGSSISYSGDSRTAYIEIHDPEKRITEGQVYINDGLVKNIFTKRTGDKARIEVQAEKPVMVNKAGSDESAVFHITGTRYENMLVVISAGHGGIDPGAVKGDIYESHINLDISFKLAEILSQAGVPYHMIRTDDTFVSLDDRVEAANMLGAELFFSIHCNSFHDPDFSGLMTLVHSGVVNYKDMNGRTAGEVVHKRMLEATGAVDRGVRFRDKIVVLRETDMPAVEIEAGFLTNETELGKLLDDSYQWKIAAGAAKGIIDVLDLMLK